MPIGHYTLLYRRYPLTTPHFSMSLTLLIVALEKRYSTLWWLYK